jgi:hypothetical protein
VDDPRDEGRGPDDGEEGDEAECGRYQAIEQRR